MKTSNTKTLLLCAAMIVVAVFLRISNVELGIFNLVPLAAISLFAGAIFQNRAMAMTIPLLALLLSDTYMEYRDGTGFYGLSQSFVYGGMLLVAILGSYMKNFKPLSVLGYTISGSLLFWIVSNFGVFLEGWNGISFAGLIQTYMMAIPFLDNNMATQLFINSFVSDIIMSGVLFGAYALISKKSLAIAK